MIGLLALPLVLLLTGTGEAAQDPAIGQPPRVTWRGSVEWISAGRLTAPAETPLNPGNAVLRIPQLFAQTEVRPHLRVDLGTRLTGVARPRVLATAQSASSAGLPRAGERDVSANWTELYVHWRPSDVIQFTYGLQNFQWGPAELLAPSNRIFHETAVFRDQLYYVRGRHLLRVNLSAGREWSLVALAELSGNGEEPFVAGEEFRRQGQLKGEYASATGRWYAGLTSGAAEGARPWFGHYASYALTEGFSLYVDATLGRGSRAWYPVLQPNGRAVFRQRDLDADGWRPLVVTGARYTFVAGQDARLEFLHQPAGYRREELALAPLALAAATSPAEAAPFFGPGLEFLGRRLALFSLRLPDLPPARQLALQGRYLRSLTDQSGVAFLTGSLEAADALVLFASASVTHGAGKAEFSRFARGGLAGGLVWTW